MNNDRPSERIGPGTRLGIVLAPIFVPNLFYFDITYFTSLNTINSRYVHSSLSHLHHFNGRLVCTLYSHGDFTDHSEQGPIVNFNLVRPDGRVVGYSEVDKLACVYDIHLRTGCFCNTGACMSYLGVSTERVKEHLKVREYM